MERRHVHFQGRVQGVGFRITTHEAAARFDVTGYVQNLPDGRVLLVAEGNADELDRFLASIEARMARYIDARDVRSHPSTGEFATFHIRH